MTNASDAAASRSDDADPNGTVSQMIPPQDPKCCDTEQTSTDEQHNRTGMHRGAGALFGHVGWARFQVHQECDQVAEFFRSQLFVEPLWHDRDR